jgi:Holliday junction DNA helicase RuvA
MFAFVEGLLDELNIDSCVVDVGGFGVNVGISSRTSLLLPGIGEHVKLYTYTSVREDGISLYGFSDRDELSLFRMLISVSGVGPKVGLAVLSAMDPGTLRMAIVSEDAKSISKAQGVGAKTAQRIVLELKDKIKVTGADLASPGASTAPAGDFGGVKFTDEMEDAISALVALGYGITDSRKAVGSVEGAESMDSSALLSASLKKLY